MKKLTLCLTALSLLLLLCACKDRTEASDATTESAAAQTTETTAEQATPDTEAAGPDTEAAEPDTEAAGPDTEAAASAPSDAEGVEESNKEAHAPIPNTIGTIILEPTEPTVGLPTPVEPTYEVDDVELPPDTFD
ncbi:MAG: hypothetical protein ACI3VU_04650 [Faecousia sp.]